MSDLPTPPEVPGHRPADAGSTKEPEPAPASRPVGEGNARFYRVLLPCTLLMLALSFVLRWNWEALHDLSGCYPGDIWYVHSNYGYFLVRCGFFPMEYPAGFFELVKALAMVCRAVFPATHNHLGAWIFAYPPWLVVNALFLGGCALWMIWTLHRLDVEFYHLGTRRLLTGCILTPTFAWFAIFNYDLVPLACCTAALLLLLRDDATMPFVLLALGASTKLFPAVLMLPFLLHVRPQQRLQALGWFVTTTLAINLPLMLTQFAAWWFPYQWQQAYDHTELQPGRPLFHLASLVGHGPVLLVLAFPVLRATYRHRVRERDLSFESTRPNPQQIAVACLWLMVSFVLAKSVFSAQYLLWLLPWATLAGPAIRPRAALARSPGGRFVGFVGTTLYELVNIAEVAALDYWRSGHPLGLIVVRLVRDTGLLGLLAWMGGARPLPAETSTKAPP